jgi:hypothetical protein
MPARLTSPHLSAAWNSAITVVRSSVPAAQIQCYPVSEGAGTLLATPDPEPLSRVWTIDLLDLRTCMTVPQGSGYEVASALQGLPGGRMHVQVTVGRQRGVPTPLSLLLQPRSLPFGVPRCNMWVSKI